MIEEKVAPWVHVDRPSGVYFLKVDTTYIMFVITGVPRNKIPLIQASLERGNKRVPSSDHLDELLVHAVITSFLAVEMKSFGITK